MPKPPQSGKFPSPSPAPPDESTPLREYVPGAPLPKARVTVEHPDGTIEGPFLGRAGKTAEPDPEQQPMGEQPPMGGMTFVAGAPPGMPPIGAGPGHGAPQPQEMPTIPPELLEWGRGLRDDIAAIRALLEKLVDNT